MKISHIEHLGIAVPSIEEALPYFEEVLGLKCYAVEEVADQNLTIAKLEQDNKNMNGLLSESRELLTTIADGGTKVSEVVLADVRALIRDIQNQIPLEGDGQ